MSPRSTALTLPYPYFWELGDNFLGKIIFNFVKFVPEKKRYDKKKFFTPLFCCCFWIRYPRSGIRDKHPGSATLASSMEKLVKDFREDMAQTVGEQRNQKPEFPSQNLAR
jgi:hypothetical protein